MAVADPELDVAVAAMVAEGARFVVVGGFSVIANRFLRAAEHIDFLAPDDDADNDRRILSGVGRSPQQALRSVGDGDATDDKLGVAGSESAGR